MCWASKYNSIICAKYLSGLFPSGRCSLPEQCTCRARSHPRRDGSRSLPWLWSLKLLVPPSSSPQTRLCPWCCASSGLSSLPLSHPLVFLSADGWAGSPPTAPPGLVHPLQWCGHGGHVWELSQAQGRQLGRPGWVSILLLLWLQGMFLCRNYSVPILPVLVFSSVSTIKFNGLGWCEINFGGILKPWL